MILLLKNKINKHDSLDKTIVEHLTSNFMKTYGND